MVNYKCNISYFWTFLPTGKSKAFAHLLNEVFLHGFDSKVFCLEDYRVTDIENEQCVLVVASTFGNGEPPDNGQVRLTNHENYKI